MLRLSVSKEEWLRIGEDINIIFLGMSENNVKIMIDAPKEIPVSRSRAREKYLSVAEYKKEQEEIRRKINEEQNGSFSRGKPIELPLWIMSSDKKYATYAIYGKGKLARDCYNTIFLGGTQRILAYVNRQRSNLDRNVEMGTEEELRNPEIDYIVVAVSDFREYKWYENKLRDMGVPKRKIIWVPQI